MHPLIVPTTRGDSFCWRFLARQGCDPGADEIYVVEEPATASTTALELFAIDWAKGRGFLYGPPAYMPRNEGFL